MDKEIITAVLSSPYYDALVIKVFRQSDQFHEPTIRTYVEYYENEKEVKRLMSQFLKLNELLQKRIVEERIARVNRISKWEKDAISS